MRVNYQIIAPEKKGASIKIKLTETAFERSGKLSINLQPFFDFNPEFKDKITFDFFIIAILVYGIDNLLERETYSTDGWTRQIDFTFPVYNQEVWSESKDELEKTLCFLTGDEWQIYFERINYDGALYWNNENRRSFPSFNQQSSVFNAVSLFSGGLDSLIGIVDYFTNNPNNKLLLASHYDSNSGGPNADQKRLLKKFETNYRSNYQWIQSGVTLQLEGAKREPSYRSRSLMFIAMGVYFASWYDTGTTLYIPENGSISLNYPLSPSRRSSLSTRTTHPYMLGLVQSLLSKVGIAVTLQNPYELRTKGQMLLDTLERNRNFILSTLSDSVSCGKRGRKAHWDSDKRVGVFHCGTCMPCIYRRAALHAAKIDRETYGIDLFNPEKGLEYVKNLPDISALIDFMKTPITQDEIEANLLINGSLPFEKLRSYAGVVINTRQEIKDWIDAKADRATKRALGL